MPDSFLICPEGYFTPHALEDSFFRVLSNYRIAPQIYLSASGGFDKIPSADRSTVLKTASKLFTHQFIIGIENKAQIFCPTMQRPFNVGSWLLRTKHDAPTQLPESLDQSRQTLETIACNFAFLCSKTWSVDKECSVNETVVRHRNEVRLLGKIDGLSLCFHDDFLPVDNGRALETMAVALSRQNNAKNRQEKKRGRRNKVPLLVTALENLYSGRPPEKTAKVIERELHKAGITDFKTTTLNTAISEFKNRTKTEG